MKPLKLILLFAVAALSILPMAARADSKPVVIRFRYWGDVKEIAALQDTIAAFEKTHPNIIIHGERVPSGDEYVQKLLVEQAGGLTPDVVFCGDSYAQFADRGILRDLTPFLNKDHSVQISRYYGPIMRVFTDNGKIYALPRDIAPMGLVYYNKSLFDKAHIPYPDGSWTWDYVPHPERGNKDFLTVAKELTHIAPQSSESVYGFAPSWPAMAMDDFVFSSGASYVDDIYKPTRINFDDPRVINAIQLTQDLSEKYHVAPSLTDLQASAVTQHDLFAQGHVAMYLCGIWEVPRFREEINNKFDWDIAAFPAGPTGLHGVATGGSGYGITTASKHPAEDWEFLKCIAGPDGESRLAKTGLAQPSIASLSNSTLWLDGQRPMNRKLTIEEVPYVHFTVISPKWVEVKAIIDPKLQLVWSGTLSAKQAVQQLMGPAQGKLDELNHPPYHPILNWWYGAMAMAFVVLVLIGWVWQGAREDIRNGRRTGSRSEVRAGYMFIMPWLVGTAIFMLGPMLVSLLLSFSSWDMIEPAKWVGLGNFSEMAGDDRFWKSLQVTGLYTVFSVPLGVAGSLALALLLNTKIKGQAIFRTLFYLPAVASAVAASLIWLRVFNPETGLLNYITGVLHLNPLLKAAGLTDPTSGYVNWLGNEKTALGSLIVMSLWGIGGGMVIYLAGLQGIPQSYYDAAEVDGANVFQKFRHVTLPLLTPTIFFTLIMGVIGSFQAFTQSFVMTGGGPNNATLFYVLYLYQNAFQFLKMGYASALAWVLFLIILCFTMLQMKMSKWVHYEGAEK